MRNVRQLMTQRLQFTEEVPDGTFDFFGHPNTTTVTIDTPCRFTLVTGESTTAITGANEFTFVGQYVVRIPLDVDVQLGTRFGGDAVTDKAGTALFEGTGFIVLGVSTVPKSHKRLLLRAVPDNT